MNYPCFQLGIEFARAGADITQTFTFWAHDAAPTLDAGGGNAVTIFFVMSGFVMTVGYAGKGPADGGCCVGCCLGCGEEAAGFPLARRPIGQRCGVACCLSRGKAHACSAHAFFTLRRRHVC